MTKYHVGYTRIKMEKRAEKIKAIVGLIVIAAAIIVTGFQPTI